MFEIDKEYSHQYLYDQIKEGMNIIEYSFNNEVIGKSAIHIEYDNKDYWFILHSATATKFFYKCVYIN